MANNPTVTLKVEWQLKPEQIKTIRVLLDNRIAELEKRPGHISGNRSMKEYSQLVDARKAIEKYRVINDQE